MKSFNKKLNLRKNYPLIFEIGLIGALLIFIAAFKFQVPVNFNSSSDTVIHTEPPIVLPPVTFQKKTPPPPAVARIPVEIPNDDPMDPPVINFGDFNDIDPTLPLPPKSKDKEETEILEQAEFMPEMKGGLEALYSDIEYPKIAKRNGIEGKVVVQFVVNKKGEVEDLKITRGIGGGCDEEVLRVIKLQTFTPGIQNGNFVKVRMKQVVHFRLHN